MHPQPLALPTRVADGVAQPLLKRRMVLRLFREAKDPVGDGHVLILSQTATRDKLLLLFRFRRFLHARQALVELGADQDAHE